MGDVSPAVSTYFLSQLAAVLIEDDLFILLPAQMANVENALRCGHVFRSVAEHHHRTQLNSLGKVALAKLYPRRGSEWSPDLLPRQLKLIKEKEAGAVKPHELLVSGGEIGGGEPLNEEGSEAEVDGGGADELQELVAEGGDKEVPH